MNQVTIQRDNGAKVSLSIPSKWDELNKTELLYIASNWVAWMELATDNADLSKARVYLFLNLLRAKGSTKVELVKQIEDSDEETKLHLVKMVDFIFEDCTLTNQLLPFVKNYFKILYGPSNKLSNLTFGEFIFTEKYFENYFRNKRGIDLVKLVAVLYRPLVSKKRRIRVDFDKTFDFEANVRLVANIFTVAEMNAIFLMYLGCHKAFEKMYKGVFTGGGDGKKLPAKVNFGMMNVAFGLADMGGLGNINDIQAHNVHVVLQRWELLLHTQAEAEQNG
jgi:hypothetical protein